MSQPSLFCDTGTGTEKKHMFLALNLLKCLETGKDYLKNTVSSAET
jgi:hypothetical protein